MALSTNVGGGLEVRRSDVARYDEVSGGVFENSYIDTITVNSTGTGEGLVQHDFNVWFVETPIFVFGSAMRPGQRLPSGSFPNITACVITWKLDYHVSNGAPLYQGATVGVQVTNGPPFMMADVHLSFRGKAIRNPATATYTSS